MTEATKRRVLVLDTSAFIMGYNPLKAEEAQYSTPAVRDELRPGEPPLLRFEMAKAAGKLHVERPTPESTAELETSAESQAAIGELSHSDREILALALKLRSESLDPVLVTDDYEVQNVAEGLGLRYASLANFGIRYRYDWIRICSGCRRVYSPREANNACPICGSPLVRKVRRADRARRKLPRPTLSDSFPPA